MKRSITKLVVVAMVLLGATRALADSPLTSAEFYKAYKNLPQLENGSDGMYNYLADDQVAIELRLAVINRAGWRFECDWTRAAHYLGFLAGRYDVHDIDSLFEVMSGMQMACLAYLLAMDDYFHVEGALSFAQEAERRCPKSYAVHMVEALIEAQLTEGCAVYEATDRVRRNTELEKDMNEAAVRIIFEYQDIYKDSCK